MTEREPADGTIGNAAAERWRTLATVHRLISGLAGRLPDPLLAQAREWLGRADLVGLAEVIVSAAMTLGVSVTPQEARTLAALPAAPGRRPGLPAELRISDDAAPLPPSLSFFQGVRVVPETGELHFTGGRAGSTVVLRAEQPLTVLVANTCHPLDPRPDYVCTHL